MRARTAHDDLQQIFGGRVRQLAHPQVIDDEQRHGGEFGEIVLARAGERGLGEFFEQRVRFPIDDAVALLDRGAADGLGHVTLAGPRWAEEHDVLAVQDEAGGRQFVRSARGSSSC
jgi:hypothetical protein